MIGRLAAGAPILAERFVDRCHGYKRLVNHPATFQAKQAFAPSEPKFLGTAQAPGQV
jgi:hypothetical protein